MNNARSLFKTPPVKDFDSHGIRILKFEKMKMNVYDNDFSYKLIHLPEKVNKFKDLFLLKQPRLMQTKNLVQKPYSSLLEPDSSTRRVFKEYNFMGLGVSAKQLEEVNTSKESE